MQLLEKLGLGVAVLALVASLATVPVEQSYSNKAMLIQRVERDEGAELFGDEGTPIGSPQQMIIEDQAAFLEGKSPEGAKYVSEKYLREKGIYPLQLKTVSYTLSLVRMGTGAGMVLGVAVFFWARRGRRFVHPNQEVSPPA